MNVALFASAFHPSLGGVEELVRQLALEYRRQGITAVVLVNRWPRSLPARETLDGIPVYRLPMRVPEYNLPVRINYWLAYPWTRARMLHILRRHRIDLVHVQCVSWNGHYAALAQRELGLPLVVTAQGERTMDAERAYEKSPFINRILRRLLRQADHITACSRNTLEDLETYSHTSFGERGSVVYNGIRLEDFAGAAPSPHPRPYILGIGRLVPQKGFDVLIEAFAAAGLEGIDLVLAGEGPERENLESLARKCGARVHFAGRADRPTAVSLFLGCAFFVLPSRHEPLGIVNLEAMAAGKAVIASRTGGVPEIVADGETGLLTPPGDVAALTQKLRLLAGNEALRARLGARGRERVNDFTWESIANSYRRIYETAVANKGRASRESIPNQVPVSASE